MKHFEDTMAELTAVQQTLLAFETIAVEEGIDPAYVTLTNATQKVRKRLNDYKNLEQTAAELGYSSLPIALKALGQFKNKPEQDISHLPATFHKVPKLWLVGRADTRKTPGFAPLTLRSAIREHKQLIPLLLEAWELATEESQDNLVKEYLKSSAEDYKQQLYSFIYENEDTPLEEELIDAINKEVERERFEDWQGKSKYRKT